MASRKGSGDAIPLEPGHAYRVRTGKKYVFQLPADWMTVSFVIDTSGQIDSEYPKFCLESTDGSYRQELSAKNDLVPGDVYLDLRFEKLIAGKLYTLTRHDEQGIEQVVFENMPYAEIVDQSREIHEELEDHKYGEFDFDENPQSVPEGWDADNEVETG